MPDYKRMYFNLFHAVSNSIEELQQAQRQGEECYISSEDVAVSLVDHKQEETAARNSSV